MNFISYYIIGIPIGVLLGFKTDLQLLGILIGMLIGNLVHVSYYG